MSDGSDRTLSAPLKFKWQTKAEDVFQAAEVCDEHSRQNHRGFHYLGVFVVIWMFLPNVLKNPTDLISWVMVALGIGLLLLVLKFPAYNNQKYARSYAQRYPSCELSSTATEIRYGGEGNERLISFEGTVAAYEYKNVFAFSYGKNELFCVPRDQMGETLCEEFRSLLREGLGDRFQKIDPNAGRGKLFGRKR